MTQIRENILEYIQMYSQNPIKIFTLVLDLVIVFFLAYNLLKITKDSRAWQLIKGIAILIKTFMLFLRLFIVSKTPIITKVATEIYNTHFEALSSKPKIFVKTKCLYQKIANTDQKAFSYRYSHLLIEFISLMIQHPL